MSHSDSRSRPLTDDEMELRARRNFQQENDPSVVELDLGGGGPEIDLSFGEDFVSADADPPVKAPKVDLTARLELINRAIVRAAEATARNKERYPQQRQRDRDEQRLKYAVKIEVEQNRSVRPYRHLDRMSAEDKAAYKREQAKLRKREQRKRAEDQV